MTLTITLTTATAARAGLLAAIHDAQVGLIRTNNNCGLVGDAMSNEAGTWKLSEETARVSDNS